MARAKIDVGRLAAILCEAEIVGDKAAAERYGIAQRTVQRYRAMVPGRPELAAAIAEKQRLAARKLGDEMLQALRVGVAKLQELISAAKPGDQRALYEVAGAVKILVDAQTLREVVHGQQPDGPPPNQKPSAPPGRTTSEGEPAGASPVH